MGPRAGIAEFAGEQVGIVRSQMAEQHQIRDKAAGVAATEASCQALEQTSSADVSMVKER